MDIKDMLTILLSSTLITTIITVLFNLFSNRKKDAVENITKERKTWRDELRIISLDIFKSESLAELQIAISNLKVRINAYGIAHNSIFADSHIWEQIYFIESRDSMTSNELQNIKHTFVNQLSCLLKFDWERAKGEIKGNMQTRLVILSLIICFVLYSARWFYYYSLGSGKIINYFSYCVVYSLIAAFAMLVINLADKWKTRVQLWAFIISDIFGIAVLCWFWYRSVPSIFPFEFVDWIIFLAPFITLVYAAESKLLAYRRNVNHFILASALSAGATKINKKYKVFFNRKYYKNLLTGETISFDDSIIACGSPINDKAD